MESETGLGPLNTWDPKPLEPLANRRYHSEHHLEAQELHLLPFTSSPLGRLPAEVRELIYGFAMTNGHPQWGKGPCWLQHLGSTRSDLRAALPSSAESTGRASKSRFALLCTCRQIYHEAHDLYYTPDFFSFKKAESMVGLLLESGWAGRRELQSIRVFLCGGGYYGSRSYQRGRALWEALANLSHCKFLRKLEISIEGNWHDGTNLSPDFMLPLEELTDVEVSVRSMARWYDGGGEVDDELEEEGHKWRLIRDENDALFQLQEEDIIEYGATECFVHLGVPSRHLSSKVYGSPMYGNLYRFRDYTD